MTAQHYDIHVRRPTNLPYYTTETERIKTWGYPQAEAEHLANTWNRLHPLVNYYVVPRS